ncbi:Late embryogenesis abundant protein 31 [Linum perenne]
MSEQQQPQRPIKYGDLFEVQGELAEKAVAPRDAAMMQTAENTLTGHTQKGGAAAVMQSAADKNERAGFVTHEDVTNVADDLGVSASEIDFPTGKSVITESVGGQVVGKFDEGESKPAVTLQGGGGDVTIGEALEAAVLTAGKKPVERSDAAAIQAAEVRATRRTTIVPGGIAAAAQSAATHNARATSDEEKTTLADVLSVDAKAKLPADRVATRKDAEGVAGAEMRNDPYLTTHPTGVAASVAAAARINQQANMRDGNDENNNNN